MEERARIIELVKTLGITAEELGITPEIKRDEVFVREVRKLIDGEDIDAEEARNYFREEYWKDLGIDEKKYKIVKCHMMLSLDAAIKYCLDVAEEKEDFDKFKCGYCKLGWEDGVWKQTCRLPSNIPEGCSWGECSESNCPLFSICLECAKKHRQLAEWLKELKNYKTYVAKYPCEVCTYKSKVGCGRQTCIFKEVNADDKTENT